MLILLCVGYLNVELKFFNIEIMSEFIGPVLPPNKDIDEDDANVEEIYGPRLPPKRPNSTAERFVGPALPPGMKLSDGSNDEHSDSEADDVIGPQLPTGNSNEYTSGVLDDFEKRALKMKQKLSGKNESTKLEREEWMTVLPPEMSKNFGLGPRSFQKSSATKVSGRSEWTETPSTSSQIKEKTESKSKHKRDEDKIKRKAREKYDEEMKKLVEKHHKKSKRDESLYDMHTKSRKTKKDNSSSSQQRKPFDRDQDLKINMIDSAKRAALVKQSKLLNSNFAHGEGKYL